MPTKKSDDQFVPAQSAIVDLTPVTVEDVGVRVYCSNARANDQLWNVQIFGGRRKNTLMHATAGLTRAQLVEFRDCINAALRITPERKI